LVASPGRATVGGTVTLTATETASRGEHVPGHIQFEVGETDIGTPVAVDASGVATTTTTFSAAGTEVLAAQFTPTSTRFANSTGKFLLVVRPVSPAVAGIVPILVTVPRSGWFTVTFDPGAAQLTPSGSIAHGMLPDVTVTDTRNYYPGWSLSGQASTFTDSSSGQSVSGKHLGWVPAVVGSLHGGAKLGGAVEPEPPGLGSAPASLAYAVAGCGFGTNVLSAKLTLAIPETERGRYSGIVTVTYVESLSASTGDDGATCGRSSGGDR
jgi:hypothetical protein